MTKKYGNLKYVTCDTMVKGKLIGIQREGFVWLRDCGRLEGGLLGLEYGGGVCTDGGGDRCFCWADLCVFFF